MALMCHGLLDGKKSSHRSLIFLFFIAWDSDFLAKFVRI